MTTLKESALAYEPQQTLNIADLEVVPVDIEITEETHKKNDTGEEFTVKIIEINDKKYRVPSSVLEGMKVILQRLPKTTHVTVIKNGQGMNTKYNVLPANTLQ